MYGHLPVTGLGTTPLALLGLVLTFSGYVVRKLGLR
jgi:LPXTG-motif cell wall-anchored protein